MYGQLPRFVFIHDISRLRLDGYPVHSLPVRFELHNYKPDRMKQHSPPSPLEVIIEFHISPLLPVTTETAEKLAKLFNTSPEFWLNVQSSYTEWEQSKTKVDPSDSRHVDYIEK